MDRLSLKADERKILGKKVKKLRVDGLLPAHVFGKGVDSEAVAVNIKDFLNTFHLAGETGLVDLKIGSDKIKPVLIREVQYDPMSGSPIHIDFYQVNLSEKVKVAVPIVQIGDQPEVVHLGEAIILQPLNEIEVEALPTDLPENIEVDISLLKQIDDAIGLGQLNYDKSKITIHADPQEIVIKLAPAVTAEMEKLLEEEAAEQAAAAAETEEGAPAEEGAVPAEGEELAPSEGEAEKAPAEGEQPQPEAKKEEEKVQ